MGRWSPLRGPLVAGLLLLLLASHLTADQSQGQPILADRSAPQPGRAAIRPLAGAAGRPATPWPGGAAASAPAPAPLAGWGLLLSALAASGVVVGLGHCRAQAQASRALQAELARHRQAEADLRAREELFRSLEERDQFFTLSRNLLCVVGYDGYFRRLNPAWEATLGLSVEELMAEPYTSVVHPDDHEATRQALYAGAASRSVVGFENRYRCKDGSYRWLSWSYTVMPERRIAFGVAQDVTERKRTEQEQRRLYQVTESLREVIAVINSKQSLGGVLEFVIAQASRLLHAEAGVIYRLTPPTASGEVRLRVEAAYGLDPRYLGVVIEHADRTVCHQAIRERAPVVLDDATQVMDQLLAEGALGRQYQPMLAELRRRMCSMLTVPLVVKDEIYGTITLYDRRVRRFNDDEIKLVVSFARQSALAIENGRLRQQVQQTAIREERSRLARELHDSVTQSLYSLALLAEGWRMAAAEEGRDQAAAQLARLGAIAQQSLREMRLLIHQLRVPEIHREGLVRALQRRLDAVERRLGIDACLRCDGELRLPEAAEEQLYWIIQEALNNALKHAGATAVAVSLRVGTATSAGHAGPTIEAEVRDNGAGFSLTTQAAGFGIDSMRERAEHLGAALTIATAPGKGTRICIKGTIKKVAQ